MTTPKMLQLNFFFLYKHFILQSKQIQKCNTKVSLATWLLMAGDVCVVAIDKKDPSAKLLFDS